MWEDTIVNEVRQVRSRHAEKFDFDLWLIFQDLKEQERVGNRKLVSFPPRQRLHAATREKEQHPERVPTIQPLS
ncbi:MAG: hypothetical protein KF753_21660 [Caldilineaceae bacterium]|nr:hypothetical protein [Caldilineaceae bacterium]